MQQPYSPKSLWMVNDVDYRNPKFITPFLQPEIGPLLIIFVACS